MDEVANKAEDAAAPVTGARKRSHHAKLQRFGNVNARPHGLTTMRQAVNELGRRAIDKRTRTGKALAAWRKELINDMGGDRQRFNAAEDDHRLNRQTKVAAR